MKRVFLIVLDSFGVGEALDANNFEDIGANTLNSVCKSKYLKIPNMAKLGIFNLGTQNSKFTPKKIIGSYGKIQELGASKDTLSGHWEIAGIIVNEKMETFPNGFPKEIISKIEKVWHKKALCNKTYSGTEVIKDYGIEHIKTGNPIVYTSADSVFQIATHENIVPIEELYKYCEIARKYLIGKYKVGRVIARPFIGEYPNFQRTSNRKDFTLTPPRDTILNYIQKADKKVVAVGKINDIFSGLGIDASYHIRDNADGEKTTLALIKDKKFQEGLCFTNLVDFDSKYGHRRDVDGYAKALTHFDKSLNKMLKNLKDDDLLIITADHGCDPNFKGTDHTREFVPLLIYGKNIKENNNLKTLKGFSIIGATICDYLNVKTENIDGKSILRKIRKI